MADVKQLIEEQQAVERSERRAEERRSNQRNAEYLRSQKLEHGWEQDDDAA